MSKPTVVYFVAGLMEGLSGTIAAFDEIGEGLKVRYHLYRWDDENFGKNFDRAQITMSPIIVAHSYGASMVVKALSGGSRWVNVKHLVLLDPVARIWDGYWFGLPIPKDVPATCFYQSSILPPWSCKIKNPGPNQRNLRLKVSHGDIPKAPEVREFIRGIVG